MYQTQGFLQYFLRVIGPLVYSIKKASLTTTGKVDVKMQKFGVRETPCITPFYKGLHLRITSVLFISMSIQLSVSPSHCVGQVKQATCIPFVFKHQKVQCIQIFGYIPFIHFQISVCSNAVFPTFLRNSLRLLLFHLSAMLSKLIRLIFHILLDLRIG